jgi:hypothetical protein
MMGRSPLIRARLLPLVIAIVSVAGGLVGCRVTSTGCVLASGGRDDPVVQGVGAHQAHALVW